MDKFESLEKEMGKELESIEQKLKAGTEMSETDLKRVDMLTHAMKSLATYKAMIDSRERSSRSYMNREGGINRSYADGYSEGYDMGMRHNSGYYPPRNWYGPYDNN